MGNVVHSDDAVLHQRETGMSRNINYDDYYRVENHFLLPVRWMSIESIKLAKFSKHSDVWSLGTLPCNIEPGYATCIVCACPRVGMVGVWTLGTLLPYCHILKCIPYFFFEFNTVLARSTGSSARMAE